MYKDANTNAEYSKELTLRVHKYIVADITLRNLDICGNFSAVGGLESIAVTIDCDKLSVEIKDIVYLVSTFNNVLIVALFKSDILPAKAIAIKSGSLNNFAPETYSVDGNTITIKQ